MKNKDEKSETSLMNNTIEIGHDIAALTISSSGEISLYIPRGSDDFDKEMPEHSIAIAALGSYWVEHGEEILKWFLEREVH